MARQHARGSVVVIALWPASLGVYQYEHLLNLPILGWLTRYVAPWPATPTQSYPFGWPCEDGHRGALAWVSRRRQLGRNV